MDTHSEKTPALLFTYQDSRGIITKRNLIRWHEDDRYIYGVGADGIGARTFSKTRILETFNSQADWESCAHPEPQNSPEREAAYQRVRRGPDNRLQIAFTGFAAARRAELESVAGEAGLRVCKGVTAGLSFLCAGPNAGPSKVAKSREQGVVILSDDEFFNLIENGEIPVA